jgi:hypothetical protein
MSEESKKHPVEKFNDGSIHVSIWENTGSKGAFRTATIQLRYKDDKSGEWRDGNSYSVGDLKHLERAATEARSRIENWQQQTRPTPKNAA